jgi:GT2 family glycosyltransferase/Flp pilus assembly protein TadD
MTCRYLFGPVTTEFADQSLRRQRQGGECLTFDAGGAGDLAIRPGDTWPAVLERLPSGWQPDFIALYLPYTTIPECLWAASVPLVGLAADWNLLWHGYRQLLKACDLVLTDVAGVNALAREGIAHARAVNLFGCERVYLETAWAEKPRDIDILFVGNLHPAVQRERLRWLGRIARLGDHRRVAIHTGVFGEAYRQLLGRARIVFNRSIRGECNRRAFEAAAAGALLFQEAGNLETPDFFGTEGDRERRRQGDKETGRQGDHQACVYYTEDNLEELLEHYLDHEDERAAIAEAARCRVVHYSFEEQWQRFVESGAVPRRADKENRRPGDKEKGRPGDKENCTTIPVSLSPGLPVSPSFLTGRVWQALGTSDRGDPSLAGDLADALAREPRSATLHNALGVTLAVQGERSERVAGYFGRAVECDPTHVVARRNWAEALAASGRREEAVGQAQQALALVDRDEPIQRAILDAVAYPPAFDFFRVEWERAAWRHAGDWRAESDAKRELLRWRLHALLAELTGETAHYYEAVMGRPDLACTQAALGCALARNGQVSRAIPHLRHAVKENPFDLQAARALFQALGESGDGMGQRRLADEQRLLAKAAPKSAPGEPWMERVPPSGEELVSLIVLCCNEVAYTRLCLESVLRHTRTPYELIVVDNGSTDDTPAYLEEVRDRVGVTPHPNPPPQGGRETNGRPPPEGRVRVDVIRNEANRGFAAGCNQALARAYGRYLVFLNNDTIVTEGWLSRLVDWALHDWPQVGMVGPVSNYAPPPQHVVGDYGDLAGLDPFAARHRHEFAGKALAVERLTAFCLLVRREVLERVGGFDEDYGLGFFEDDDLCVRARQAAFRLLVAQDVFIHHFGSRTIASLGIDGRQQLEKNLDRFRAKWGEERAAAYRMTLSPPPLSPGAGERGDLPAQKYSGRMSLCMIVKNEEANLAACLFSAADLVDEIIVVDTGSTDATKAVARECGARVYDFPWVDDFAAARNESLRHATGDWILWLDGDDRLDEENRQKLKDLFARLKDHNVAYAMKCRCLPDPQTGTATVVDHVRLFRNHPDIRWKYRVHEQILPAVRGLGGSVQASDIVIEHTGYVDLALRHKKQERDIRILELDRAEHPDDPFILFNLGWSYEELRKPAEALPLLRRSLELSHPSDSIVRKLYTLLMECHRQQGRPAEALGVCQEGRRYYPNDAQLLFQEALLRRELRDLAGAEACLVRLISTSEGPHFASVAEGLRGHKARHNLAVIYQEQGRFAEAEAQWKAGLMDEPTFAPAFLGLGELYLGQGRWAEFDQLGEQLDKACNGIARGSVGSVALRVRGHMARRDFAAARHTLEESIGRSRGEVLLWTLLSHTLLQEGRDTEAAERALGKVLELDPANVEAKNNLTLLGAARIQAHGAAPLAGFRKREGAIGVCS